MSVSIEHKEEIVEMETLPSRPDNDIKVEEEIAVLDSRFAHLGFKETVVKFRKVCLICMGIFVGALFDGFAIGIPGNMAANTNFIERFGTVILNGSLQLDATHVAAWGGIQSAGQIVGMLSGGFTSDRFGRKANMYILVSMLILGIILECTAQNWIYFLMSRFVTGWGTGLVQTSLTVYVAEIAPTSVRSTMLTIYSGWFALGQFSASIAIKVVNDTDAHWRNAFLSQLVFIGLFIPILIYIPESPWFHSLRGEHDRAKQVLQRLNGKVEGYDVEHEYAVIRYDVDRAIALRQASSSVSWLSIFKGVNGRRTWVSFFPLACQQFVGIPLVFGNMAYFFQLAGVADPFLPVVIQNVLLIVFLAVAAFTVHKLGRRVLFLTGASIMLLCNLVMGIIGSLSPANGPPKSTETLIAMSCIWVVAYAMSAGPLGWAYVADTATPIYRAKTASFAAAGTALFGLIFNYTTPIMISPQEANWGIKVGYFFAGLSAIAIVGFYFTVPETKGRTFQELDELFESKTKTRHFKRAKTQLQLAEAQGLSPASMTA